MVLERVFICHTAILISDWPLQAKVLVDEMKKDPAKMKELEQAMELMKDPAFQAKVCIRISALRIVCCMYFIRCYAVISQKKQAQTIACLGVSAFWCVHMRIIKM